MKKVSEHVGGFGGVLISNVWVFERGGERFLVDTGHFVERGALRAQLWAAGVRRRGDLTAVILTHRHSDHAGNASWLRRTFDCPIACHAADAEVLEGRARQGSLVDPRSPWWVRALCHVEDHFPARSEVDEVYEGGEIWRGFRVLHTPGHTRGSVLLHHEETQTLFSGDSIVSGLPFVPRLERVRLAYDDFSEDGAAARQSVRDVLAQLPPTETMCSGHGPAVTGRVDRKLQQLLRRDSLGFTLQ